MARNMDVIKMIHVKGQAAKRLQELFLSYWGWLHIFASQKKFHKKMERTKPQERAKIPVLGPRNWERSMPWVRANMPGPEAQNGSLRFLGMAHNLSPKMAEV